MIICSYQMTLYEHTKETLEKVDVAKKKYIGKCATACGTFVV